MNSIFIALFLFAIVFQVESYKILGIFPSSDHNNFLAYRGLFKELADRGHETTLISHFEVHNAVGSLTHIPLSKNLERKKQSYETVISNEISRVPFETLLECKAGNDDCKTLVNNTHVLDLIRDKPVFDVIIVESYNSDCGLALAANLSVPYIAFSPEAIRPWQYSRSGITFNSAYIPLANLPYGKHPWFFERIKSFILYYVTNWVYYVASQVTDHVYLYKYLGDDLPSMESLASNASLVLVNSHQSLFGGVPRGDNVIDIGGIHINAPKNLPTDILNFINEAQHGVIYVNLGPDMVDDTLPTEYLRSLLATFSAIPLRVLWKWNGKNIEKLPNNVMTMRWFPQYDILKHDNVKVFVTRADIFSTIESVDSGTPTIAIPLFGNEHGNSAALRDSGVATVLAFEDIKKSLLLNAINDVLNPSMQERAKIMSQKWNDRITSPVDTAIYWIEYVARYRGEVNLTAPSVKLPLYQTAQWDVFASIAFVIGVLAFAFFKIFSFCCSCCSQHEEVILTNYSEERRNKRVKFE